MSALCSDFDWVWLAIAHADAAELARTQACGDGSMSRPSSFVERVLRLIELVRTFPPSSEAARS